MTLLTLNFFGVALPTSITQTCKPRLTEAAMETLQNYYVQIRQGLVEEDAEIERRGRAPRAVPITVRQLEAIVRISESVAKMRLSDIATEDDVQVRAS